MRLTTSVVFAAIALAGADAVATGAEASGEGSNSGLILHRGLDEAELGEWPPGLA